MMRSTQGTPVAGKSVWVCEASEDDQVRCSLFALQPFIWFHSDSSNPFVVIHVDIPRNPAHAKYRWGN
jgi:hypothetical protein